VRHGRGLELSHPWSSAGPVQGKKKGTGGLGARKAAGADWTAGTAADWTAAGSKAAIPLEMGENG